MVTSLAPDRDIESEALAINLHFEEVKAFSPCSEIIGFLGGIELRVQRVEETVKKMLLVFFCDSNPEILDLELNPRILLF